MSEPVQESTVQRGEEREPLSGAERKALKAQAHTLVPVATIGTAGPTANVIAEIDRCLARHELIKIRASSDERTERDSWMAEVCHKTGAQAVQSIGKILVIYRKNPPEAPAPAARSPKARRLAKKPPSRSKETPLRAQGYAVLSHTGRPPRPGRAPLRKPRSR